MCVKVPVPRTRNFINVAFAYLLSHSRRDASGENDVPSRRTIGKRNNGERTNAGPSNSHLFSHRRNCSRIYRRAQALGNSIEGAHACRAAYDVA
jgi:hypothetical protein